MFVNIPRLGTFRPQSDTSGEIMPRQLPRAGETARCRRRLGTALVFACITRMSVFAAGQLPLPSVAPDLLRAPRTSSAIFDVNRPLTIGGTVDRIEWVDKSPWLHMDVTNETTCETEEWIVELVLPRQSPDVFSATPMPAGMLVVVDGYQA